MLVDKMDAKPFFYKGGRRGVLLIHGYTAAPVEMDYLGRALNKAGYTTSGVLLAGHGATPEDMIKTGWRDWYASAENAMAELSECVDDIFVAGLSMGGALTLMLCAQHGGSIRAAAVFSPAAMIKMPAIKIARPLSKVISFIKVPDRNDLTDKEADKSIFTYSRMPLRCAAELYDLSKQVQSILPQVTVPLLAMQGKNDRTVWPGNAEFVTRSVASEHKKCVILQNCGHTITVDVEKDAVAAEVISHFGQF